MAADFNNNLRILFLAHYDILDSPDWTQLPISGVRYAKLRRWRRTITFQVKLERVFREKPQELSLTVIGPRTFVRGSEFGRGEAWYFGAPIEPRTLPMYYRKRAEGFIITLN